MEVRELLYDEPGEPREETLVLNFFMDCRDAMGANMINTTAEHLAPEIEALTGAKVRASRTKAEALAFCAKLVCVFAGSCRAKKGDSTSGILRWGDQRCMCATCEDKDR
jgi:hypothetical protein